MKTLPTLLLSSLFLSSISLAAPSKFTPEQLKLPGKKGIGFILRPDGQGANKPPTIEENIPKIKELNVSWNYSWGSVRVPEQPANIEFIPMIWGGGNPEKLEQRLTKEVIPNIKGKQVHRLLGFNEPDKSEQANMPYTKAIELWPTLEKLDIPLCSPACANPAGVNDDSVQGVAGTWMRDFMKEADAKGLRVDYIGVHWYGGANAASFKGKMRQIYEKYGNRPLLITEFAPADWHTNGDIQKHRLNSGAVLAFMKDVLPWMESQDWIAGYAWFPFKIDSPVGTSSALFDAAGKLTPCGKFYQSVTPQNPKGDQTIQIDNNATQPKAKQSSK